mmetsp:Transcript_111130/g.192748  ORF Transcript_111130/g.192748 Transcript_111130/m.192748 type:complete len:373 (+) Transcript_111130:454-1572(+)
MHSIANGQWDAQNGFVLVPNDVPVDVRVVAWVVTCPRCFDGHAFGSHIPKDAGHYGNVNAFARAHESMEAVGGMVDHKETAPVGPNNLPAMLHEQRRKGVGAEFGTPHRPDHCNDHGGLVALALDSLEGSTVMQHGGRKGGIVQQHLRILFSERAASEPVEELQNSHYGVVAVEYGDAEHAPGLAPDPVYPCVVAGVAAGVLEVQNGGCGGNVRCNAGAWRDHGLRPVHKVSSHLPCTCLNDVQPAGFGTCQLHRLLHDGLQQHRQVQFRSHQLLGHGQVAVHGPHALILRSHHLQGDQSRREEGSEATQQVFILLVERGLRTVAAAGQADHRLYTALVGHWHAEDVGPGTAVDATVVLGVVLWSLQVDCGC